MTWTTIRSYVASRPVVFMNTTTSYTYDSSDPPAPALPSSLWLLRFLLRPSPVPYFAELMGS